MPIAFGHPPRGDRRAFRGPRPHDRTPCLLEDRVSAQDRHKAQEDRRRPRLPASGEWGQNVDQLRWLKGTSSAPTSFPQNTHNLPTKAPRRRFLHFIPAHRFAQSSEACAPFPQHFLTLSNSYSYKYTYIPLQGYFCVAESTNVKYNLIARLSIDAAPIFSLGNRKRAGCHVRRAFPTGHSGGCRV